MKISIHKIIATNELQAAFRIREEVFVIEQQVPKEEEYDEFEATSTHFLAIIDNQPCGTARWRFTDKGIKLERFAVAKNARGQGVGRALVKALLEDVKIHPDSKEKNIYLHAQVTAMPLYEHFGFKKEGDMFDECGILHYKMKLV